MLVWVAKSPRIAGTFHLDEHCLRFKSAPIAKDLSDIRCPEPCGSCTDAPRMKFLKIACAECGQSKPTPCRHNGGVLVKIPNKVNIRNKTGYRIMHVWPDKVHHYSRV